MYKRTGHCGQCGDCCRAAYISPVMSQENNIIDDIQYCDFVRKEDGVFICSLIEKLKLVDELVDIGSVVDSKLVTADIKTDLAMSDEQVLWCTGEIDYPNPLRDNHCPPCHNVQEMHPNCTYFIEEANGS